MSSLKAKVLPINREFDVAEGETLLDAALRQGISYPHACKSGRCGACKLRLKSGEVEHLSHLRFTLTEQEKKDGVLLACRAVPKTDVEVSWFASSTDNQESVVLDARVVEKSRLTHDTVRLVLEAIGPGTFHFLPGQFALLGVAGHPVRSYSMANHPQHGGRLEFFIREVPGGRVSTFISGKLDPHAIVRVEGPFGASYLRQEHLGPILAIGGGSGIAPIKSIVDAALRWGMRQEIHLYFGVREERDFYLLDHFQDMARDFRNFRFHSVMDRGDMSGHQMGRLDEVILSDWKTFTGNWHGYIAGPPPLVEAMKLHLLRKGFSEDGIFADPFFPSQIIPK